MRVLIHLSDLHFGRVNSRVLAALSQKLKQLSPHLIILSGDLTQRARTREFRAAREFLTQLDAPWLAVPGNHDVPLFNVYQRFFQPFKKYREWIHPELNPCFEDEEMLILGANTAHSWTFSEGRLTSKLRGILSEKLRTAPRSKLKILVCHHPLKNIPPQFDLILSGHLHKSEVRSLKNGLDGSIVWVQAGTAISTRYRNENNSFNHILLNDDRLTVKSWVWNEELNHFMMGVTQEFQRQSR